MSGNPEVSTSDAVSADPTLHLANCSYRIYLERRSASMLTEGQTKERLLKDLLRLHGSDRKQPEVVAAVEKQVSMGMSGSGIIFQYMKSKAEICQSYELHLKSLCNCESAKMTHKVPEAEEERMSESEALPLSSSKVGEAPEFSGHEDILQASLRFSLALEGNEEGLDGESNNDLEHQKELTAEETPANLEIAQPGMQSFIEEQLRFLEDIGLDLSDYEEDVEQDTVDAIVGELNLSKDKKDVEQDTVDAIVGQLNLSEDEEETEEPKWDDANVVLKDVMLSLDESVEGGEKTDGNDEQMVSSDEAAETEDIKFIPYQRIDDSMVHDELDYGEDSSSDGGFA